MDSDADHLIVPDPRCMCIECVSARLTWSGRLLFDLMREPGAPKPPAGREAPSKEWLALVEKADRIAGVTP